MNVVIIILLIAQIKYTWERVAAPNLLFFTIPLLLFHEFQNARNRNWDEIVQLRESCVFYWPKTWDFGFFSRPPFKTLRYLLDYCQTSMHSYRSKRTWFGKKHPKRSLQKTKSKAWFQFLENIYHTKIRSSLWNRTLPLNISITGMISHCSPNMWHYSVFFSLRIPSTKGL